MNEFDFFQKEHRELNDALSFQNKHLNDYKSELELIRQGKYINPISTGIPDLDKHFNMFFGMLLLITGYPQSGKSEYARFLSCVHVSLKRGKVCIFSPESDTPILIDEVLKTVSALLRKPERDCEQIVNDNFIFQEIREDTGMPDIKDMIEHSVSLNKEGFNFFIIDPMNWVTSSLYTSQGMFESLRLTLTSLKQFAKRNKSIMCYIEHPKTPLPNKDGSIPLCSIFSVNGGVMHNNKVDGAIILHRQRSIDEYGKAKSSQNDPVLLEVAKLKFQKYLGTPDNLLLHYDWKKGTYESWNSYSNGSTDYTYQTKLPKSDSEELPF